MKQQVWSFIIPKYQEHPCLRINVDPQLHHWGKNGCELTETPIAGFRFCRSIVMHTDIVIVILISLIIKRHWLGFRKKTTEHLWTYQPTAYGIFCPVDFPMPETRRKIHRPIPRTCLSWLTSPSQRGLRRGIPTGSPQRSIWNVHGNFHPRKTDFISEDLDFFRECGWLHCTFNCRLHQQKVWISQPEIGSY